MTTSDIRAMLREPPDEHGECDACGLAPPAPDQPPGPKELWIDRVNPRMPAFCLGCWIEILHARKVREEVTTDSTDSTDRADRAKSSNITSV